MRCAYFDCFSGVAGDMTIAALVDAGCPLEALQDVVQRLSLPGVELATERVKRHGLAATRAVVRIAAGSQDKHRHLRHIVEIIDAARLPAAVAQRARSVFERLAVAEAAVHGTTPEKVHFHEVGAADAIVDIVCACAAVEQFGIERVICSPIPTGTGTLTCEHGVMPVPAPATAELLRGVPLAECAEPRELTTPTGAALMTTLASSFGPPPAMRIERIGYGAGTAEGRTRPNLLRVLIGELEAADAPAESDARERDRVVVLEAQVDDSTPQALAFAGERLLEAGALDAFLVPIIMKKGRSGQLVTVICQPADAARLEALLLAETTSFGVRRSECTRARLARSTEPVATPFGEIRVKVGRRDGRVLQAWPEYEDCAVAARRSGTPLREVQQAALAAWARQHAGG